jgi:hypothetical protein
LVPVQSFLPVFLGAVELARDVARPQIKDAVSGLTGPDLVASRD